MSTTLEPCRLLVVLATYPDKTQSAMLTTSTVEANLRRSEWQSADPDAIVQIHSIEQGWPEDDNA